MATAENVTVDDQNDRVHIEGIEVHGEEVVEFFSGMDDAERGEMAGRAVEVGVTAMRLMETSKEVEHVDRRVTELQSDLEDEVEDFQEELDEKFGNEGEVEQVLDDHFGDDGALTSILDDHLGDDGTLRSHIEDAFGEDGVFKERLDEELGEDGEKIKAALDPDKEGTPTYRLKRAVLDDIRDLRDELVADETEEELRSRTHLKGGDFEDTVEAILGDIVRQTNNSVEYTGDTEGELDDRQVGDFVLTLGDTGQRIVIEAKTEYYGKQDIQEEMEEAIVNRDADFGVFVTDSLDSLPETKVGWFNEFPEDEFVSIALSEDADADIEPGYLRIAFNWARMRAVQAHAEVGDAFDPEVLQSEIDEVEDAIGRFGQIRGHCTEIEKSKNSIKEELSSIESEVTERLSTITAELNKADS
jgi:hypothetical protein